MEQLFKMIASDNPFSIQANPWIETTLREDKIAVYLHLMDRSTNWKQAKTQPSGLIDIDLASNFKPKNILLQPTGQVLKYQYNNGRLTLSLPEKSIGIYQIIQILK